MRIGFCITAAGLLALAACGDSGDKADGSAAAGGNVKLQPGEWEMKIQLRPDVARSKVYSGSFPWYVTDGSGGTLLYGPGEDPYLTARGIAGTALEGITCAMFDPTVSAYDLRLVRRPD